MSIVSRVFYLQYVRKACCIFLNDIKDLTFFFDTFTFFSRNLKKFHGFPNSITFHTYYYFDYYNAVVILDRGSKK